MTNAMVSMAPKVTMYCASETANVKRGGTQKKSKDATFNTAVSDRRPAPEPQSRDGDAEQIDHGEIGELEMRIHDERQQRASRS